MADPRADARAMLPYWQRRLRLSDWQMAVGDQEPVDDEPGTKLASVDIDVNLRVAVISLRGDTPTSQVERQVVHELVHVVLSGLEDVYRQAKELASPGWAAAAETWWHRHDENAVESLVEALTGAPRAYWCAGEPWDSAFPVPT